MPIDQSIASGGQPLQIPNALANYAQYAQIHKYTQDINNENKLNAAMSASISPDTGEIDPNKFRTEAAKAGVAAKIPAFEKTFLEGRKLKAEVGKSEYELNKTKFENSIGDIIRFDTHDDILSSLRGKVDAKELTLEQAQRLAATVPQDPAQIPAWQIKTARSILSAKDQLEQHFMSQDTGGGGRVIATPKYGGGPAQVVQGSQFNKTATPGERMTDARERDRIANAENPNAVVRQVVNDNGTVTNFNKFGQVVSTVAGAGKQSATYAKTQAQQKTLAADQKLVIGELTEAIKEGGLIDQSTGSGAGRLIDAGAGFFGKATEGDIAIGRLQPIADIVLKTVPRFEGPQSDKDTASYKEAAGNLANANLPREKRKAAAQEIIRLMQKRQGQFITSDMASGNTATPAGVAPPEGFVPD